MGFMNWSDPNKTPREEMKMASSLDTSGCVRWVGGRERVAWRDLTSFAHGYIEALFADMDPDIRYSREPQEFYWALGFSDLAPETLAQIIADCEAALKGDWYFDDVASGGFFWDDREDHFASAPFLDHHGFSAAAFPPLTVTISDDGLIRFAETGQ